MKRWSLVATLLLIVGACGPDRLLSPDEIAQLHKAEARWRARTFVDYTYEYQQSCFCPPELNQWSRVTVRGGAVVKVEAVDPASPYEPTYLQFWQPIDSLFTRIRSSVGDVSYNGAYSDIIVSFDPELGFPTYIEYKEKRNVADAASVTRVRNVQPLN